MSPSMHALSVGTFVPLLQSLSNILDKAARHASAKAFDPAILVNARLAPDMVPLSAQIRFACDLMTVAAMRLAGREAKPAEMAEATLDDLKARVAAAIVTLESLDAQAFIGAEARDCTVSLPNDLVFVMTGADFLRAWSLPNIYFHVVTAYDILRHNGVDLGKADYMAHMSAFMRQPAGAKP